MKSERLFEILLYLIEKKDVTATELANKFDVSVRTIYRDIDSLTSANIPIYTTSGNQGGIHLMDNYVLNKALLTSTEKEDILFALKTLQTIPNISTESVLSKIIPLFKTTTKTEQWIEINFSRWGDNSIFDDELFQTIKNNIINKKRIIIEYANEKGEYSKRTIEPLKLIFRFRDWYLHAFCLKRNDYRLFKLKRIASIQQTNYPCQHTGIHESQINNFIDTNENKINFVALFPIHVAHYVYDIFSPDNVELLETKQLKVSATVNNTEWFHSFLLFFGTNIEIIEPPELAETIRQLHYIASKK
ncbi:MAG: YafY family transcriptional regulator [Alphaproteobacteria bacterium]|nr:YafY family transcriptional regulator [Alphaproteobacteria bacterium]